MKTISHSETFTLSIDKEDFLEIAIPLVDNIDEEIKNELMHCCLGIINGNGVDAGYTWQGYFYNSLESEGKIKLTDLGVKIYKKKK